ncbi:MAG: right-handed parallel beta-helix repeat-containing protein [Candidatus Cloacimonetes bacterium]|nr:right-handed parallel beta-helix repeat-containing protein [Candidatus Cloacimonadota bacterium]
MRKKLLLIVFLFIITGVNAETINVPADYDSIQVAIEAAENGDIVLVQPGTYTDNIDFLGKSITVGSLFLTTQDTTYISETIIDGDSLGSVVKFQNGEDSSAVLCGFTITNGSAHSGAGIYVHSASPHLHNLNIIDNVGDNGGGIYCYLASPRISQTYIGENIAGSGGGAMFINNSNARLENLTIANNSTYYSGAGIYCGSNSEIDVYKVVIEYNQAGDYGYGGGIFCTTASPHFENVILKGNRAYNGGAIECYDYASPTMKHIVIANNSSNGGGGIFCWHYSSPQIEHATISHNDVDHNGAGIRCVDNSSPSIINSIVSYNTGSYGIYATTSSDPTVYYSDFYENEDGNFYGVNDSLGVNTTTNAIGDSCDIFYNIQMQPMFSDIAAGDFHLTQNSPCIDAGDPDFPLDPDSTIADMGAYYYNQGAAVDQELFESPLAKIVLFPNPVNPKRQNFNIEFKLKNPGNIRIKLFNIKGQLVSTILDETISQGSHTISQPIPILANGIYFAKLIQDGKNIAVTKVVLLK